jgi:hypothetical protein
MHLLSWRERHYKNENNNKETIVIRRLCCNGCKKIHHELPDILIPYKRHCRETIEKILSENRKEVEEVECDESTVQKIKAWWSSMQLYFSSVMQSLSEKLEMKFTEPLKVREIVRAVANSHLWIHTRSVYPSG